ncbi:virion-associated protein [Agrobacterium phage Milano]|nr:virion-associated protein [Agrobacterium phage Milano]
MGCGCGKGRIKSGSNVVAPRPSKPVSNAARVIRSTAVKRKTV